MKYCLNCDIMFLFIFSGFMHKEMNKADVVIQDSNENPEAPHPNEMMELEVYFAQYFILL